MTEAVPFLQKAILLSYDPRPLERGVFYDRADQKRDTYEPAEGDGGVAADAG